MTVHIQQMDPQLFSFHGIQFQTHEVTGGKRVVKKSLENSLLRSVKPKKAGRKKLMEK
jgi:hypothetical protein